MSDHFGISTAIKGALAIYFQSARRTGRTTSLLESLKDGDRVVFATLEQAKFFERLAKDAGLKIDTLVIPPDAPLRILGNPKRADGRMLFDHVWIEEYYKFVINDASIFIDKMQAEGSASCGFQQQTRRKAEEIARWRR